MKKYSKVVGIFLVVILVISLCSCGKQEQASNDQSEENQPKVSSTNDENDDEQTNEQEETKKTGPSWTWDTSPVEFTLFVDQPGYQKIWDSENCAWDKKVTEETGISLTIDSGEEEKLNALIASDSLPDYVVMWTGRTQRVMLENNDRLYSYDDLIKEYAPTFDTIPESMRKWFSNEKTGKNYCIANYFFAPEQLTDGNYLTSHNRLSARKDIMDQLGIKSEDFSTKQGMNEALKRVKDSNIEYNGFSVEPFYLGACSLQQSVEYFAQYCGVNYEDKDGNWVDWKKEPETLEGLLFANKLYRDGLLSVESLTIDNSQLRERVNSGRVFCTNGSTGSLVTALTEGDENALMVPVGPFKGDNGREAALHTTCGAGWTTISITKNCKKPDRAVRFLEYLLTPEKATEAVYGPEGVTWDGYDENGKIKYTDEYINAKNEDPTAADKKYGVNSFYWTYSEILMQPIEPLPIKKIDLHLIDIAKFYSKYTFNSTAFGELVSDGGTEEAAIEAKIEEKFSQYVAEIILSDSEENAKAVYEQMIEEIDKLGWQKYYDGINKKFLTRKNKLEIDFAHPYNQEK